MDERDWLVECFEEHRPHMKAVAYRMLGSLAEADDAVQDAWLRVNRSGIDGVDNVRAWLTRVVARVCLNALRSRNLRREEPVGMRLADPLISLDNLVDPEQEVLLADSVGLALQVVLETLAPPERLAFVLHDMFDVPFDEIAPLVGCSVEAARQMASRARRRVRGSTQPDAELVAQRRVVDAFVAAARGGDLQALIAVLDPNVVSRSPADPAHPERIRVIRGADAVARAALGGARTAATGLLRPVLMNGAAGLVLIEDGQPRTVWAYTVARGKIVEIDMMTDPERIRRLGLTPAGEASGG
ncbi:MAG TPA: sigma-70 family RNA polymerase sigma factor [Chloroflexota bacterium]|nr:sigma-70 family RNA polymerase sigma factor [Chloroflexota bacterium]